MDLPTYDGNPFWTPLYRGVYRMMGMSSSRRLSRECLAHHRDEPWLCFIGQYASRYVKTPTFIANSFYDYWQSRHILNVSGSCAKHLQTADQSRCSAAELEGFDILRAAMVSEVSSMIRQKHAYFLYSCVSHSAQFDVDTQWTDLTVRNVSLRDAFSSWYFQRALIHLDDAFSEPSGNPTCFPPNATRASSVIVV